MRIDRYGKPLLLLMTVALMAVGCGAPQPTEPEEAPEAATESDSVALSELRAAPDEYLDTTVSVVGQIDTWFEPNVVMLTSCTVLDREKMLVTRVPEEEARGALDGDVPVRIVGTVSTLSAEDGPPSIDLSDPAYSPFIGRPYLEASSVEVLTIDVLTRLSDALLRGIRQDPEPFIGREVALQGGIRTVMADRVFTMVDPTYVAYGNELLVVAPSEELIDTPPTEGAPVGIRGTVQWFDAEDVGRLFDVSAEALGAYDGEVIVAASAVWIDEEPVLQRARMRWVPRPASVDQELQRLAVLESPASFSDQWVVLTGEVVRLVGEYGFVISGLGLSIEQEILVLSPFDREPFEPLAPGRPVLIGGETMRFRRTESESLFDLELDDAAYAPFEGEPAILAETLRIIPATQVEQLRRRVLEVVASAPDEYLGTRVAVHGEVKEQAGEGAFVLSSGLLGEDLLVVKAADGPTTVDEGVAVTAIGVLDRFVQDRIGEAIGRPLVDGALDAYEGEPVLIVDRIESGA